MKYEWRKKEKSLYLPKETPTIVEVPELSYLTITGEGNPNMTSFSNAVATLYKASYTIKMLPKKGIIPDGYYDYTVFPLEGFWDSKIPVTKEQPLNLDQLIYKIMIRQPDFVTAELVAEIKGTRLDSLAIELVDKLQFETIKEGRNIQMMHVGSYADEIHSFNKMDDYCKEMNLKKVGHQHKEIYVSDPKRVAPEKLKTVLRFPIH
ncbi:GyrI-like domain-containing protein [Carnobacterium divergens]|uniref:GyrI-like domain-containing protein n=1 Tax=Carnobacterium divergens TaxID=2748 RepID=UPI001071DC09|nr:GyrI-like domain-containing protein [Carnobacterium divergens]TFI72038.1 hypothetical protein CKN81_07730 [Carnobacterium divergens]